MVANRILSFHSVLAFAILTIAVPAFAAPAITYQGRIIKPDGNPLSGSAVRFRFQIRSPEPTDCLMYEEISAPHDMSESKGQFSLSLGDGSGTNTSLQVSENGALASSLSLVSALTNSGTFTFLPAECQGTNSYSPGSDDGRTLVVSFRDETMSTWEPIPAQKINSVPYAFSAHQIAGFGAPSLVRVVDSGGVPVNNLSPLSNTEYQKLLDLIAGTSTEYERAGRFGGAAMPATSSLTTGQVLSWNGTSWAATSPAPWSGSVPGVNSTLANVGIGTTAPTAGYALEVAGTAAAWRIVGSNGAASTPTFTTGSGNGIYSPNSGGDLGLVANSIERVRILGSNGNVGVGTTSPISKLNVNGAIVSNTHPNDNTVTTIDFSKGNVQTSAYATGNPAMNLCGLADGGSYTLILTAQPNASTPVFAVFSDAACSSSITHLDSGGIALTTSSPTTIITFIRAGSTVYAMLATGFTH